MTIRQILLGTLAGVPMFALSANHHGIDKGNLDPTANPKDDFYQYACGGWIAANPLTGSLTV